MPPRLTFHYIAGFFDAEGWISSDRHKKGKPVIGIGQAVRQDRVLYLVAQFLRSSSVRCSLRPKKQSRATRRPQETLTISDWKSILNFLEAAFPYLVVKKAKAEHAIAYIRNKTWRASPQNAASVSFSGPAAASMVVTPATSPRLSLQYIAGFFDGEGWISYCGYKKVTPITGMRQAVRPDRILHLIADFLRSNGVRFSLHPNKQTRPTSLPQETLLLLDWRSILKFLKAVHPYLIVKRVKAEEAIAYIRNKKWRERLDPGLVARSIKAYQSGMSLRQVERQFNIPQTSLFHNLRVSGVPRRSRSEGVKLSWSRRERLEPELIAMSINAYQSGMSVNQVERQFSIPRSSLFRHLRLNGVPTRSRSEAAKLFWPRSKKYVAST